MYALYFVMIGSAAVGLLTLAVPQAHEGAWCYGVKTATGH